MSNAPNLRKDPETPAPGLEAFTQEFIQDRMTEIATLDQLLKTQEFDSIRMIAHKWKGYSEPYGFGRLEKIGQMLEETAISKSLEECSRLITSAKEYLNTK